MRGRDVKNEEELLRLLQSYGFLEVSMEKLGLREQLALSANAECIVGPHGAGMAHVLFARLGSLVVEFFPPGYVQHTNFAANALFRHRHYSVTSGQSDLPVDPAAAVIVPLKRVEEILISELGSTDLNKKTT